MRALFVVDGDRQSASTRHRVLNILPYLEESGIETEVLSLLRVREAVGIHHRVGDLFLLMKLMLMAPKYDVVYIGRLRLPQAYISLLVHRNSEIIFDFDDALYTTPSNIELNLRKERRLQVMLSHSKLVIAGSPILEEYAKSYNDNIRVLPTAIPREQYPKPEVKEGEKNDSEKFIIGWIGNPTNLPYLKLIEEQLELVLDEYDHVQLHIITSVERPTTPLADRVGEDVIYRKWSLEREREYLREVDVGIRPLPDTRWTRGKGGYTSVVQMMASGIPTIVSSIGMLPDIVIHEKTGYLVENDEDWRVFLTKFINDSRSISEMRTASWERIDELGFWTEDYAERFESVLFDVFNGE